MTPMQTKFRSEIESRAKEVPRFLFRFWHSQSGGYKALNTVDAITPLAYLNQPGPEALHMMDPQKVKTIASMHLSDRTDVVTVFSSWTQSFYIAYTWPRGAAMSGREDIHIVLLDTAKLRPNNVVLHTAGLDRALNSMSPTYSVSTFAYEYLAFNVIHSEAFEVNSLYDLLQTRDAAFALQSNVIPPLPQELFNANDSLQSKAEAIRRMSRAYSHLSIVMAAHLMANITNARLQRDEQQAFVQAILSKLKIPEGWAYDSSIVAANIDYHGYTDAANGAKLLKKLVVAKYGKTQSFRVIPEDSPQVARAKTEKAMKAVEESTELPAAVKKHYPRMLKELAIESNGWDIQKKILDEAMSPA